MFDNIVALGYGIIVFAIVIGVGSVVLYNFGGAVASCSTASCGASGIWNGTAGQCSNATAVCGTPTGAGYTNTNYMLTQLGSSGLIGYTPALIAISIGMLFLGYFAIGKGKRN